jgi:hypothetical protein
LSLVLRALHKDPAQRPQTAELFRSELAAALGVALPNPTLPPAAPQTASRPTAPPSARRPAHRRSFAWALVAIGLAAFVVAAAAYFGELPLPSVEGRGVPSGTFTRTDASRQLQERTSALSHCVAGLAPGPAHGQPVIVDLAVSVEPDGRLSHATVPPVDGLGDAFAACVREEVERWRLPHGSGEPVVVTLPWRFRRP